MSGFRGRRGRGRGHRGGRGGAGETLDPLKGRESPRANPHSWFWGLGRGKPACAQAPGRDPKGALRPGRPGAWTLGIAWTLEYLACPHPHDGHPETRAHGRQRPDTSRQGHTDAGPPRHGGTRLPPPRPQGRAPRRIRARYLHVVDDGLEEPAQGAAAPSPPSPCSGRAAAQAWRWDPRRGGCRSEAGPGLPPRAALSGRPRRARGWRAAAGRRGPCRGGAGGRRGGRGGGGGRRSLGLAGDWRGGRNPSAEAGASRGRGGGAAGRVCGEAGRAPAHSPPRSPGFEIPSPGAAGGQPGRPGGRRRRRGGGAAGFPAGVGPAVGRRPVEGSHLPTQPLV